MRALIEPAGKAQGVVCVGETLSSAAGHHAFSKPSQEDGFEEDENHHTDSQRRQADAGNVGAAFGTGAP